MSHHIPYSRAEIAEMIRLAKLRGFPVEGMTLPTFIEYLKVKGPDIINDARYRRMQTAEPTASLYFDGEYLFWNQAGNSKRWLAYSGTEKFWGSKNFTTKAQGTPDGGPLPEGGYSVRQAEYQELPDSALKEFQGRFLGWTNWGGTWPGWEYSWGAQRIWLVPLSDTNTYGRSNFTIHGGQAPGSRGCIDLVGNMAEFAAMFRRYGKDMHLTVNYEKYRREENSWESLPSAAPSHHK